MKIAVVTQYFPVKEQPYRGHSAFQTLLRLKSWADIEVFAPQSRYPKWLLPKNRPWAQTDLSHSVAEIPVRYFDYPAVPVLTRAINGSTCAHRLMPLLAAAKPDVILNYWLYPDGYAAVKVGKSLGIPVVVSAIGTDLHSLRGPMARWFAKKVMDEATLVMTVSNDLKREAVMLGVSPNKVHAILNGCDRTIFHPGDMIEARRLVGVEPRAKVIAYVGRLDLLKGLRELVQACSIVAAKEPELRLVLIGEGPARGELQALGRQLGIADKVHFAGVFDSRGIANWLRACDVFTLPSYAEGCPNVVVEALNCGRPVVATNVGGIPELVDDACGILVPPRDSARLADALYSTLQRPWSALDIAGRSRRDWDDVARDVLDDLQMLLGSEKVVSVGAAR